MAESYLTESSDWIDNLFKVQTDTKWIGGDPGTGDIGSANRQALVLGARTRYLKALYEALADGKQPLDATLTALASLVGSADKVPYFTGNDSLALTTLTAFCRTVLAATNAAGFRTVIGAASSDDIATAVAALVNSSPATLDTLAELAAALGNDANFATTITNSLATKVSKADLQAATHVKSLNAGTANALVGHYSPPITELIDGMELSVYCPSGNTSTAPTFKADSTPDATIVKGNGLALSPGDILPGWATLRWDATLAKWTILDPATGVNMNGAFRTVKVFTESGTYTTPAGVKRVKITCVGGGGSGSGGVQPGGTGGGGGAAGACAIKFVEAAALGASQTVTIGAGGTAVANATNGNSGGTSSFGALCSASGGAGGTGRQGGVSTSAKGGSINLSGGWGNPAPNNANGCGGSGGNSVFGGGGRGGVDGDQLGYGGAAYGAGGGGGGYTGSATSGPGASGIVIVEEFF